MASEIDELRQLFTGQPRPTSWAERRQRMDDICAIDPPPEDVTFTAFDIAGLPAEWSLAPGSDETRVLLYFHGGGYCSGSIRSHRAMVGALGKQAGIRTLAIGYRLAPEYPYPAALDDALAAWRFLRSQGYAPEAIAIGGDSAGGNLTLATLIALREAGEAMPAAAWLVSPWTDLTMSGATLDSKAAVDPLISRDYLNGLAQAFLAGRDARDPAVSPLFADLSRLPPTLVQVGSSEGLLDDAVGIARALGAAEVPVVLEVWPQMIHAWMVWAARLADGRAGLAGAAGWLRAQFALRTG
ncbi:acetyl esterase/lipase [Ancylobacter aquaticus]|uniref:Acetyl esterase/lipase n=1 Tax=Ancylobacter aquaticus TaxID=100 RepID=A0A4R1I750_ANCAQ|nr:alpha/beta hydrolase [Ancylobacter aquaticus]TCK31207.1 acetyl esterase/lipase [Ancylobacter aquaticus]